MGALGLLRLHVVLPELPEDNCDIKILISTTFSRHISGNRASNHQENNDLALVEGRASRFAR